MTVDTIACNQCGAPLSIPGAAQFVTCNHCGASLAVRRSESVTYTEVVAKLVENTSRLAKEVAHLRYQSELARIDREWEVERRQYLIEQKNGPPKEPNRDQALLQGFVIVIIGVVLAAFVAGNGGGGGAVLVGGFALVFGVVSAMMGAQKAADFERARLAYLGRRGSISVEDFLEDDERPTTGPDEIPPLR